METSIYILGGTQFNPITNGLFPFTACQVVFHWGFPSGSVIEESAWVRSLDGEDLLEKRMATHSSILAGKILRPEEPGGLQSVGSQSGT